MDGLRPGSNDNYPARVVAVGEVSKSRTGKCKCR
ncbi:hypothetical protein ENSA7_54660 [Enhygromyxa salina]|uniref:Uncharacterized protein n=1 Tax=Enhygromyxa salina TaxID=215803 RepID=A0A2S9YC01_9BACT|nr:hypothetical protein ENSA7_77700 [Enhygromyxa salina]PRQ02637.1 hypothetical protein ENSA7_54660 [Enhygromyxa salina]